MEIVDGTASQHQHAEKKEVEQNHEPSDHSSEPSGDSSNPSNGSSEPTSASNNLSCNEIEPSSDSGRPSGNSSKSLSDNSSQPTSEISDSKLSESEYSSTESSKQEQPKQTDKPLNLERSENVSNIAEQSIKKKAARLYPDIPNDLNQEFVSSAKENHGCGALPKNNLSSNKLTYAASCDVSKPALEPSVRGCKVVGASNPSFSSGSTENRLTPPRISSFSMFPDSESNTSDQDLTDNMSVNQVDYNSNTFTSQVENNSGSSSLRKRTHSPVSESKLLVSESAESAQLEPCFLRKYALIGLLFAALIAGLVSKISSSFTSHSNNSPLDRFSTHVHEIKQNFPSQNHKFWKTLEASTHRILKGDVSRYPAVILMASSLKNASVALCLARNISSAFDSSVGLSANSALINFKDFKHLTAAEQKVQLDSDLNSALGTDKRRSLVLENLQLLDPLAAVLFYSYCDNDYAPFKDVLILLTLYFDDEKEKIGDTEAVENYLEMIWSKGLITDKVKPLLSRVANHIVIVQGESPETLNNRCL
ncbi:hypothetical protein BsWGS_23204 [Bradybaena similaris]